MTPRDWQNRINCILADVHDDTWLRLDCETDLDGSTVERCATAAAAAVARELALAPVADREAS